MATYLVRRVLGALLVLVIVSMITFGLFFALPTDPARLACGKSCTPEIVAGIRANLELDQPVYEQYWKFAKGIFVGRMYGEQTNAPFKCDAPCLGYSFKTNQPVFQTLMNRAPATISVAIGAAFLWLVTGLTLGVVSALKRGTVIDKTASAIALIGASLQIYFVGLVLQAYLVSKWQWLPSPGYTPFATNPAKWASGLILPWITLTIAFMALYTRLTRASMLETLSEDYIRTARAKGLTARRVNLKHALRAAITPIVTIFGLDLGGLLGGAVITEYVFNIPGIGRLAQQSVLDYDLPLIMGTVMFAAFFIILANLVVDIVYSFVDPKVRLG